MESPWKEVKKNYVKEFIGAWKKHGIVSDELHHEHVDHPAVRGLRGITHAIMETPIGYSTYPREDINALLAAAKKDREFARMLYAVALKYGEVIPNKKSPESYIDQIAQQPRGTIRLSDPIRPRGAGNRLEDLKRQLMRDIEDITKYAYRLTSGALKHWGERNGGT